ncbi:hypothetical protein [Pseudomonas sp. zfem002]|uniref:hypothetical protein n=1 Tax=Pseudomonas sp. zfem002 TaxID=3078197 RepID=UPI00292904ED|nr:hypothetical protein [Pseudomonas sp. zfem002]MDU9394310.1 hypothetical protein [Pseudomonas sp. zfem002]
MTSDQQPKWQYQIGPGPDLTREIGQIIVNYSECERSIFDIFRNIMSLSDHDAYLLVRHANVNAEKMLAVIKTEIARVKPAVLVEPIKEALDAFKSAIEHRNIVAHWQWAVTEGDTGLAFNAIKSKPNERQAGKPFELSELKATAWKLAKAATLLANAAIMMFTRKPASLSQGAWAPNGYSNRTVLDEWMIEVALARIQEQLQNVEDQILQDAQPSS